MGAIKEGNSWGEDCVEECCDNEVFVGISFEMKGKVEVNEKGT
jgi:hypothetical protein